MAAYKMLFPNPSRSTSVTYPLPRSDHCLQSSIVFMKGLWTRKYIHRAYTTPLIRFRDVDWWRRAQYIMCGVRFSLSALSTQRPLRNPAMSLPSSTSIPPRLANRNGNGSIQLTPPLPIETLVTDESIRALPPRMNPGYKSSQSVPRSGRAPTSGVEDRARQGSQTTAIAAVVEALNSTHINRNPEDDAHTTDSDDEMLVDDTSSPSSSQSSTTTSPGPRICQWSPTCNADLCGVVEVTQASDHLRLAHGLRLLREGRTAEMHCPWPGCKSKSYQIGSAPRHFLDQHINPEGKSRRRKKETGM